MRPQPLDMMLPPSLADRGQQRCCRAIADRLPSIEPPGASAWTSTWASPRHAPIRPDTPRPAPRPLAPTGTKPPGRGGAMLIDDPARGRVILFGGKTADGALADHWELSLP